MQTNIQDNIKRPTQAPILLCKQRLLIPRRQRIVKGTQLDFSHWFKIVLSKAPQNDVHCRRMSLTWCSSYLSSVQHATPTSKRKHMHDTACPERLLTGCLGARVACICGITTACLYTFVFFVPGTMPATKDAFARCPHLPDQGRTTWLHHPKYLNYPNPPVHSLFLYIRYQTANIYAYQILVYTYQWAKACPRFAAGSWRLTKQGRSIGLSTLVLSRVRHIFVLVQQYFNEHIMNNSVKGRASSAIRGYH